jgi:hypothetical protein
MFANNPTGGLMSHSQAEFSFDPTKKPEVVKWLKEVQKFFHPPNIELYKESQDFQQQKRTSRSSSRFSVAGKTTNFTNAPSLLLPFQFSLNYDLSNLGDILEGATINYLVQLISNLGHFSETIREQAVTYIYQLSVIIRGAEDPKDNQKLEEISLDFQIDDKGKAFYNF